MRVSLAGAVLCCRAQVASPGSDPLSLGRRAEVTLDGVWPTDKTSRCLIKSPERLAEMDYEGRLEAVSRRQGARFKEYRPETGSWVFKVSPCSSARPAGPRRPGVPGLCWEPSPPEQLLAPGVFRVGLDGAWTNRPTLLVEGAPAHGMNEL